MNRQSKKIILGGILIVVVGLVLFFVFRKKTDTPKTEVVTVEKMDASPQRMQRPPKSIAAAYTKPLNIDRGDEDIDWLSLPSTSITLNDKPLTITKPGTYTLSGKSNQGVVVNCKGNVRLVLNGVTISNENGAAIYIENAQNTVIQLLDGSENLVEDSPDRGAKKIDGVIYSSDDLIFVGAGMLTVKATLADGIVSKDDLRINSGTFQISGPDDGIRGKDSVAIFGGSITINVKDDGIKSSNDSDAEKGFVYIEGGKLTIDSGDDAIKAQGQLVIDGGEINIRSSVEGLEATGITINGGQIKLIASDDGINATSKDQALRGGPFIIVNGGTIDVTVGSGDTDAFDSNGDLSINGGEIYVTAPTSSFDADGKAEFTGGEVTINGEKVDELPKSHMGGGRHRGPRGPGRHRHN